MGIIKTAMMSGVGIYGIKKLAKSQENRHSTPNPSDYPRDYNNYPPQGPQGGYWGPPGPPPRGPRQGQSPREDAYYGEYPDQQQQQRQWYPAQGPADGRYARGYSAEYEDEKYTNQDGEVVYQARQRQYNDPPAYGTQQQGYGQQQGPPYESRGPSGAAGLLGTAMQFVGNQQGGDGKKGKKLGKGGDMINEFLGK